MIALFGLLELVEIRFQVLFVEEGGGVKPLQLFSARRLFFQ